MKPFDIAKAYDQIIHLWSSDKFDMNNGIEQHKKALSFTHNKGNALDIGCGCTGRFIALLLKHGFTAKGIDISSQMLSIAKKRQPNIDFIHADICDYEIVGTYDFISAWDSLWHVPLAKQRHVITKIVNSLNPSGIFIFSFGGTAEESVHTDNSMGPNMYYSSLSTNAFIKLLIDLNCSILHMEFDQSPELHAYLIAKKN